MRLFTLDAGFPTKFTPPVGVFPLCYSDDALRTARQLGLDMTYLPLQLTTHRAELVEILWDGDTSERLHTVSAWATATSFWWSSRCAGSGASRTSWN